MRVQVAGVVPHQAPERIELAPHLREQPVAVPGRLDLVQRLPLPGAPDPFPEIEVEPDTQLPVLACVRGRL